MLKGEAEKHHVFLTAQNSIVLMIEETILIAVYCDSEFNLSVYQFQLRIPTGPSIRRLYAGLNLLGS